MRLYLTIPCLMILGCLCSCAGSTARRRKAGPDQEPIQLAADRQNRLGSSKFTTYITYQAI